MNYQEDRCNYEKTDNNGHDYSMSRQERSRKSGFHLKTFRTSRAKGVTYPLMIK